MQCIRPLEICLYKNTQTHSASNFAANGRRRKMYDKPKLENNVANKAQTSSTSALDTHTCVFCACVGAAVRPVCCSPQCGGDVVPYNCTTPSIHLSPWRTKQRRNETYAAQMAHTCIDAWAVRHTCAHIDVHPPKYVSDRTCFRAVVDRRIGYFTLVYVKSQNAPDDLEIEICFRLGKQLNI